MWRLLFAFLALPLAAEEVDVELALMVDVSRSMSVRELELQRRGYAEAIRSDAVLGAIENGYLGAIAVTYIEWAGRGRQRVVVPWTRIAGREDAERVADALLWDVGFGMRRTSISGAIDAGREALASDDFTGLRRVIDVSGDGPNNEGGLVTLARNRATAEGIVVNGLPLMTRDADDDWGRGWGIDDLDVYYVNCVIGGPGAFVIPVHDWSDFPLAVRRKLVLELAQATALPPLGDRPRPGYDCMIGEKLRARREGVYGLP